ncbi:unnamed protein product [Clonostachys rhizophaga]|uniref:Uncharacterized protein n=1 Tax=Clonostachys rhizophaga TaxID=160324 RepID=A0A9N9YWQ3_9HYPO|nr:unnamed protein product [Clonostachys rhizophaga]
MHTIRTLGGSTRDEALDPPHRPVNYDDDGAVRTVTTRSRQIWLCRPEAFDFDDGTFSNPNHGEAFGRIARFIQNLPEEELVALENLDTSSVHTPLRDMVYWMWNHVFWDVARFLSEVNCNTGTFRPPAHEVLAINYPETPIEAGKMQRVTRLQSDCNIMMGAVYVAPGVRLRFLVGQPDRESFMTSEFDSDAFGPDVLVDATKVTGCYNEPYVHWIRRNRNIQVFLEGRPDQPKGELAVVFVYGKCQYQPENTAHPCVNSCDCDEVEEGGEGDERHVDDNNERKPEDKR